MSGYPTIVDYNEVVQHPETAFRDPLLKSGTIETNSFGLPKAISGGFALTYTVASNGNKYAVRCFHRQVSSLEVRYEAISNKLNSLSGNYFVKFEFEEKGILVKGQPYPIVRMDWVEGPTLGSYVEANCRNRSALETLRSEFQALSEYLETVSIAHGDFQNGNVILNKGHIKLIDYDGMYVSGIKGKGTETGHKHFQHPLRSIDDFGPRIDRFSLIAIDLSLQAISTDSSLFDQYYNGENLIFTANDYADPDNSPLFRTLLPISALKPQTQNFIAICRAPIAATPSLADFLAGKDIPKTSLKLVATPGSARPSSFPSRKAYIAAFSVVDANDYIVAEKHSGDRIELIGRIVEVTVAKTRYGRPYVFIKFGIGRDAITKINIWSDGLANFQQQPSSSLEGKWVSVTGLLEPYTSRKRPIYTNLSITITTPSELKFIDEAEAKYRLGSQVAEHETPSPNSNREVLKQILSGNVSVGAAKQSSTRPPRSSTPKSRSTSNQQILADIRASSRQPSTQSLPSGSPSVPQYPKQGSQSSPNFFSKIPAWVWWLLVIVVFILLNRK